MLRLKPLSVAGQTPDYLGALANQPAGTVRVGDIVYRGYLGQDGVVTWSFLYHVQVK